MSVLLALETSSIVCSVALFNGAQLVGMSELRIEKSHSSHITVMISQLLENCGIHLKQLNAVAISGGPGSYTGLRIGSSTAKGLCYSLNIPLLEVSTLYSLAAQVIANIPNPEQYLFCPMLDARRMEVYTCIVDHNLHEILPVAPLVLEEAAFQEQLSRKKIIFLGSGAEKFKSLVAENSNALFVDGVLPSARMIGDLALQKYEEKVFEDVAYYEPFYLKDVYITSSASNTSK
ncbi:tRNA (adenosine(37)-N6)-threonylcarbamoyltransferase complex dimerization subunit type 1 TsaB [Pontibacter sp. SGAir0037]|uniref:tRNA (adenosine(37)-N6)-threonylcarbamoyltransferase complex dimerization subunit type 1 TsaB n=1 Tax=Pontibacter sp. SGAir0037 TaxID=2571030 RepID=UPI0010CCC630|nr:tRNA (adenosine(37)-N6)-threonylcarbamoyltransferase complex dimerization subunit type 1 TsaB [Pontibacter sp. SGAir0037]QCR24393.1 tRNA (adenosine(37)-N6)-threonylcarbamoyltransferase complex dimerization subunit type 1 TsaB [Pontibacter sp. SGAir0037]